MSSAITLAGSCLCGAIKYRVAGDLLTSVNCHCSMCRKAHGAAFRSGARRTCGSHMLARSDTHPAIVSVAIGTVDGDLPLSPRQHWNVACKASWFEITDQLPQFPVIPSPS